MWYLNPRPSKSLEGEEEQDGKGGLLTDMAYPCHTRNNSGDITVGSCEKLQDLCVCGPCGSPVMDNGGALMCTWHFFLVPLFNFIGLCLYV